MGDCSSSTATHLQIPLTGYVAKQKLFDCFTFRGLYSVHGITSTPRAEVENALNFSGTRHCALCS